MSISEDLFKIADIMEAKASTLQDEEFNKPLQSLIDAAERIGRSWSGSWLGYHSRVYYEGLADPPPGARFSQEWGMMDTFAIQDTVGEWREYRFDDVIGAIKHTAGDPDTTQQEEISQAVTKEFEEAQSNALSLLSGVVEDRDNDKFLSNILSHLCHCTLKNSYISMFSA